MALPNAFQKNLQCAPPDQAKHNKPSLDANGRLEVIFNDVLCIIREKNRRRWRLSYDQRVVLILGVLYHKMS